MSDVFDTENMTDEEVAEKAYLLGHRSKEDFKGDPEKWVDARSFLKKANENMPILRDNFKKIDEQNNSLRKELEQNRKMMAQLLKTQQENYDIGYKKAKQDLQLEREEALENADIDLVKRIDKKEKNLDKLYQEQKDEAKDAQKDNQGGLPQEDIIAIKVWEGHNEWYREDRTLHALFNGFFNEIKFNDPSMPLEQVLREATKLVKEEMPQKFGKTNLEPSSPKNNPVLSGNSTASSGNVKTYASIPADDRDFHDKTWASIEKELRVKKTPDDVIKARKASYQAECVKLYS